MSPTTAITDKEKNALSKFRVKLSDLHLTGEQNTDLFLLKWIRAKEMDLAQAEAMLRKNLIWRKENDMENILTWAPPTNFKDDLPFDILGHDKDGCPIIAVPYGLFDVKKAVDAGKREEFLKYIDLIIERGIERMKKATSPTGEPVTQFVVITDMQNLSYRQLTSVGAVDAMMESVKRYEANYPDTLKTCIVINSSRIFVMLFGLIKPFLSAKTSSIIQIYASNASKWKPILLKNIDAAQLPEYFGGTSSHHLKWQKSGKKILDQDQEIIAKGDFITVTISAGKELKLNNYVKQPNSVLSWSFKTNSKDIGFSIQYENGKVVPYKRTDSHLSMQSGSITCMNPGNYIVCFDNTFSRMTSKVLHYNIKISSP